MSSKPKSAPRLPQTVQAVRILLRPQHRGPLLAAIVVGASLAGLLYAWQRWGEPNLNPSEYAVAPAKLRVTPQPAWIQADVKAEVLRTAGLTQLDVRDPKLVEELAAAFALHPWVAEVERVQKRFPPRVDVALKYRRPAAAVEISSQKHSGLLFVDAQGVLLPSVDFSQQQARQFLRIAAGNETPAGIYGTAWGSPRVTGAARLAAAWEGEVQAKDSPAAKKRWQLLGLYRIVPIQSPGGETTYELHTQSGARVVWGAAPGSESTSEPAPEQKMAALEHFVADKGSLDRDGGPPLIDLRTSTSAAAGAAGPRPDGKSNR